MAFHCDSVHWFVFPPIRMYVQMCMYVGMYVGLYACMYVRNRPAITPCCPGALLSCWQEAMGFVTAASSPDEFASPSEMPWALLVSQVSRTSVVPPLLPACSAGPHSTLSESARTDERQARDKQWLFRNGRFRTLLWRLVPGGARPVRCGHLPVGSMRSQKPPPVSSWTGLGRET